MVASVNVIPFTLPDAPGLRLPPLSLLQLAPTLLSVQQAVDEAYTAVEKAASAQAAVSAALDALEGAPEEERAARAAAVEAARDRLSEVEAWQSEVAKRAADAQRWESSLVYLPELGNLEAMEVYVEGSGSTKRTDATQTPQAWYDPFTVVAHDDRSLFGYPNADFDDRAARAMRALIAHEAWQVEHEFWTGVQVPTNYHLTASPATPTTSPHRTIDAFPDVTPAPGTVLGTPVGLKQGLAALDQAIADSDAGTGMIHATPFVVQYLMGSFSYLRDSQGRLLTVNMNLIVPGYGYTGTGPDTAARNVTDGHVTSGQSTITSATAAFTFRDIGAPITGDDIPAGTTIVAVTNGTTATISAPASGTTTTGAWSIGGSGGSLTGARYQWAFATDMVWHVPGAVHTYPWDFRQGAPEAVVNDSFEVRAERMHALLTNKLLRAAVLIDTQTA